MAQTIRPDSTVTATSFTNGFAAIDEATASDADFAYGANNTAAVLEVGLSNPAATPGSGTTTVRYRVAKTNAGTVDGGGNAVTVTCDVYQGTTLIASDAAQTATGTWAQYSFTPDMSAVTDWNDLRLRFTTSASGGSPANRRGGAVSWAELEAPDAAAPSHDATGALVGPGATVTGSATRFRAHAATGALVGAGAVIVGSAARSAAPVSHDATGALVGPGAVIEGSASRTAAPVSHDATGALVGPGAVVAGTAARTRVHAASGALLGAGAVLAGVAAHNVPHAASGALIGPGATVTGSALRSPPGLNTCGARPIAISMGL